MSENPRLISSFITFFLCVLIVLMLFWLKLSWPADKTWPPKSATEITLADETFVEVLDEPKPQLQAGDEAAAAQLDEFQDVPSELAPETGTQLKDNGPKEQPAQVVTQTKPSPAVVEKKEQPQKAASAVETKKKEEEASAKRTNAAVSSAFAKADAKNNANNRTGDEGKSGKPTGNPNSAGSANSNSTKVGVSGSLGGGWVLPKYNTSGLNTSKTGSIIVEFVVHPDGSVSDVKVVGGAAPVGSDTSVQAQVLSLIKNHKPSRTKGDTPDRDYTAKVTFTFK